MTAKMNTGMNIEVTLLMLASLSLGCLRYILLTVILSHHSLPSEDCWYYFICQQQSASCWL